MEERLRELEERLNLLQSLTLRIARWTNFNDDNHEEKKTNKSCEKTEAGVAGGESRAQLLEGRKRSMPTSNAVAKKRTSGIRKNPEVLMDKSTAEAEDDSSNLLEEVALDDSLITVKEEPDDDFDDEEDWPEGIVNYPSPSCKQSSPENEVLSKTETASDEDFFPSSSTEEEPTSPSSSSSEEVFVKKRKTVKHKPSANERKKRSSASTTRKDNRERKHGTRNAVTNSLPPVPTDIKLPSNLDDEKVEEPTKRTFPCKRCGETFPLNKLMLAHRKAVHPRVIGQRRWPCSFCDRHFISKCYRDDHECTHTGEKPHLCELCGYAAANKGLLKSHMECMHEVEKKRKCDVCQEMFRTKGNLAYHKLQMHTDIQTHFSCSICGGSFLGKAKLKRHIQDVHEKLRKYDCEYCDKKFKRPCALKNHMDKHRTGFKKKRGLNRDKPVKIVNMKNVTCKNNPVGETSASTVDVASAPSESLSPNEIQDSSNPNPNISNPVSVEGETLRFQDSSNFSSFYSQWR